MSRWQLKGHVRGRRKVVVALAVGALAVGGLSAFVSQGSAAAPQPPWLNSNKPIAARVNSLLRAMTLPEKVGQMDQQLVDDLTNTSATHDAAARASAAGPDVHEDDPHRPEHRLGARRRHQQPAGHHRPGRRRQHRLRLGQRVQHHPAVRDQELAAAHSADLRRRRGARVRPSVAGAALPAVDRHGRHLGPVGRSGRRCRYRRTRCGRPAGSGTSHRCRTCPATTDGAARTRPGPRSPCCRRPWAPPTSGACRPRVRRGSLDVAATVKHFAGYSQSINGHDRNEALLPLNYLQSVMLPSYAGGIDAGAGTVMVDSGSINGVPATASHYLLTDILRKQMGFQGVVISDYQDVPALQTAYHVAADLAGAIAKAVNAGVDMSMEVFSPDQWQAAILQDVRSGAISRVADRRGGAADPHAEVPARPVRPAVRPRPERAVRRRHAANAAVTAGRDATLQRRAGVDHPAAQPEQRAAALRDRQGRRHRSERGLDDQPARRLERQLAGRLRRRPRLLHGSGRPDPAGHHRAEGHPGRRPQRGLRAGPGHRRRPRPADAYVVAVGEKAYAEGLGDNPAPQLPPDQQALITALEGDRQAGDRRRDRRPSGRARVRPRTPTAC